MKTLFRSRWATELEDFTRFRQTYFTSGWPRKHLQRFDRFAAVHPELELRPAIEAWLRRIPCRHPITYGNDRRALRQFCLYRRRFDPASFVPQAIPPTPGARGGFRPRILTLTEVKLLLKSISTLRGSPLRHARIRALLLVLYCTGLRLGEALRLRVADVDLKRACFRIGPSKGRTRLVPFGRDLAYELRHWLSLRRQAGILVTPRMTLFEREDRNPDNTNNAYCCFCTLFRRCQLKPKPATPAGTGRGGLRVHDLRHTFAVHRLQRWYRAGIDPGPLLPWLSAYLG